MANWLIIIVLQVESRHVEYYLNWCWALLRTYGSLLQTDSMPYMESLRALIRAVGTHEKEIMKMSDENMFNMEFLCSQAPPPPLPTVDDDNGNIGDDDNFSSAWTKPAVDDGNHFDAGSMFPAESKAVSGKKNGKNSKGEKTKEKTKTNYSSSSNSSSNHAKAKKARM